MRRTRLLGLALIGFTGFLGVWVVLASFAPVKRSPSHNTPLALQAQHLDAQQTSEVIPTELAPLPVGTSEWQPPTPGVTPTIPEPTITPTPAILQPAILITPSRITTVTQDLDIRLDIQRTIDTTEPLIDMAWAPTGDKLLYVTQSGKLYWCNLDASNATLLQTYDEPYRELTEQMPLGNVLFANHIGRDEGDKR